MNVKQIVQHHDGMRNKTLTVLQIENFLDELQEYLNKAQDEGKEIVVSKINEEDFVKTIRIVKNAILASDECENNMIFMMLDSAGSLEPLLHTITMSMIGILADEEVI